MSGAKDCEETTDLNFDKTIPFRPFIHLDCDDLDDDVFYIQTDPATGQFVTDCE